MTHEDDPFLNDPGLFECSVMSMSGRIEALEVALRDCAEDLALELYYRYRDRDQYPSEMCRYRSAMEPVYRAQALVTGVSGDRSVTRDSVS